VAIRARDACHLARHWRWIYVVCAMTALYLNVFVLVVQLFQKVPALKAMAPTQSEPPFAVTQLVVLGLFVLLTIIAAIKFRGEQLRGLSPPDQFEFVIEDDMNTFMRAGLGAAIV